VEKGSQHSWAMALIEEASEYWLPWRCVSTDRPNTLP
jgi:hypothetical protein